MGASDSSSDVTREDVRGLFSGSSGHPAPLGAADVADRLHCTERTANRHLAALVDGGDLQTGVVDGSTRVWWLADESAGDGDEEEDSAAFSAFVSAVRDYAIFTLEPDGTVASWNDGAERIKGYSTDEIVGEHFSSFYTDGDVAEGVPAENLETAAREGRVEDEGWRVRKDGTTFWGNVTITAVRGDDGTLHGFTKVTRDMTERREYEQQLQRERDQTEKLLRTAPVAIAVHDADGETVLANERARESLGIFEQERLAETVDSEGWEIYEETGDRVSRDELPSARVLRTGDPVSDERLRFDPPNGESKRFRVNSTPLFGPDDALDRVVTVGEDVTELTEKERALERRKNELETELSEILGRVSDAFYAVDEEFRFTHVNDRAEDLLQRPREELLDERLWDVFPSAAEIDDVWDAFHTARDTQEATRYEVYYDHLEFWVEANVYPSETGLSVYFRDVTERKAREQALEASNERLEQFAYAASHDLQEPLRMVSSYLQLVENRYADALDEDGREFVEFAVDGADRMRNMIEGLLEYSRVETHGETLETVDLDAVFADVREDLTLQIRESDAEITVESLPSVEGDADQLRQVFQNLLDNAIEYSGDAPPVIDVTAERDDGEWVITVSDEGIGIDTDDSRRIFDVFHRLHTRDEHSGTGIGLALCQRIVERHGGEIWVDSDSGEGATFSFTLPAADGAE